SGAEARAKLAELLGSASLPDAAAAAAGSAPREHRFWSTQPVPQLHQHESQQRAMQSGGGPIETRQVADIPKQPYALLDSFEWCDIDVTDDAQLEDVYRLLNENYVEDGAAMFRFDYSRHFLRWALLPPGWRRDWHVGVRVKSSRKLVAFITAVPATIVVHATALRMVEINFLCVHKKLRSKRLAPVLIREITRRVNLQGIWQAAYTAGALLPRPVSSSRYYHRLLNAKKLIETGFSRLKPRMTMARTMRLYALKSHPQLATIRPMVPADVSAACALLDAHHSHFDLHVRMTADDVAHWLLPRDNVMFTYVVPHPDTAALTDLVSFYSLPSSVINHPVHKTLNAAYAFCIVPSSVSIQQLIGDALILARANGFDVFNALDLAHNAQFFDHLKFHKGDGTLNYYLYNWNCPPVDKHKNALVLL
ncbi:unnamed protein product, partial [Agarophyton chilense]